MLKTAVVLAGAMTALAAVPAHAEDLSVNGQVLPYCSVRLGNVSSGTASIAFDAEQKVATLQVACNQASGTKLTVNPQNGDLTNSSGRINYAMRLNSSVDDFKIETTDTDPGDTPERGIFIRQHKFDPAVATGVDLNLFMNVNVANKGDAPDSNGTPQFSAKSAPAGTYTETFTFTVGAV